VARTGQRRLSDLDPERHEPVLRTRLLAADPDDVAVCRALFDVLLTTRAAPLWRAAGARLAACARQEELADWTADTFSAAVPLWRVQPLCHNPAIAAWLLEDLANYHPHTRVAAIKALAPRIHEPDIHRAVLACLHDTHMHVCSTALEVLRPVAGTPAVRDALLALYGRAAPLKGCVDRALRRCLRAAAGDEQVRASAGPRAARAAGVDRRGGAGRGAVQRGAGRRAARGAGESRSTSLIEPAFDRGGAARASDGGVLAAADERVGAISRRCGSSARAPARRPATR
jgi:hypothetical protein